MANCKAYHGLKLEVSPIPQPKSSVQPVQRSPASSGEANKSMECQATLPEIREVDSSNQATLRNEGKAKDSGAQGDVSQCSRCNRRKMLYSLAMLATLPPERNTKHTKPGNPSLNTQQVYVNEPVDHFGNVATRGVRSNGRNGAQLTNEMNGNGAAGQAVERRMCVHEAVGQMTAGIQKKPPARGLAPMTLASLRKLNLQKNSAREMVNHPQNSMMGEKQQRPSLSVSANMQMYRALQQKHNQEGLPRTPSWKPIPKSQFFLRRSRTIEESSTNVQDPILTTAMKWVVGMFERIVSRWAINSPRDGAAKDDVISAKNVAKSTTPRVTTAQSRRSPVGVYFNATGKAMPLRNPIPSKRVGRVIVAEQKEEAKDLHSKELPWPRLGRLAPHGRQQVTLNAQLATNDQNADMNVRAQSDARAVPMRMQTGNALHSRSSEMLDSPTPRRPLFARHKRRIPQAVSS